MCCRYEKVAVVLRIGRIPHRSERLGSQAEHQLWTQG
jgi:uncharacterized protein (DUF924 family)